MNKTLLFLVNVDWFFVSHRLPIALAAIKAGYEVHLACKFTDKADYLSSLGIYLHPLKLSRSGTGIVRELSSFFSIFCLIKKLKPDIVHFISIKPVIYGGLASRLLSIKGRLASVSGLGYVFIASGFSASVFRLFISGLYKAALGNKQTKVIFQNPEDRYIFLRNNIINKNQAILIVGGSGVSLEEYPYLPESGGIPVVTFASRLLKDKGVEEFVHAARIIENRDVKAEFWLIGDIDQDNPAAISQNMLAEWRKRKNLKIWGYRKDIPDLFSQSNIIVLPSYREGMPRVLLEAASCGRAVVTTDVPGCRDAIIPNKTGLLVPVRNSAALADAIQKLIENAGLRQSMGKEGRALAERDFAIEKIVKAHLDIYKGFEI
jgi:glycosyltransferase involved in cell wall biosynthesis